MLLLLAACAATPTPSEGAFSALTYNVAGLPEGLSGSNPEQNMPQIAPLLDAYDLALIQEDFAYHEVLSAGVAHPHTTGWGAPRERPVGDGLTRFSWFPLGVATRVQWAACHGIADSASDCLAEKGFAAAESALAEDATLLVVNHHAEAGGGPEDIDARRVGFAQLAAWLDEHAGDRAVIVGGDTNLRRVRPDDAEILDAFLDATGLSDACEVLSCGADHIDRFLFRSGADLTLSPTRWAVADEFVDARGEDLSDHPAIHVDWTWRRAELRR